MKATFQLHNTRAGQWQHWFTKTFPTQAEAEAQAEAVFRMMAGWPEFSRDGHTAFDAYRLVVN